MTDDDDRFYEAWDRLLAGEIDQEEFHRIKQETMPDYAEITRAIARARRTWAAEKNEGVDGS